MRKSSVRPPRLRRLGAMLGAVVVSTLLLAAGSGCQLNPATGQRNFNVLSTQQEVALGEESAPQFVQSYGGEIPSAEVRRYVSDLGQALAAESERPELPWEFFALDSSVINAFALPGGKVFITRGLIGRMNNEAQLAAVLGHEIGHVTAQHIGQQMSQALGIQLVSAVLAGVGEAEENDLLRVLGAGTQLGGSVYLLSFGRGQEHQADELGLRYMTALNYNPTALLQVMAILQEASGGAKQPEFFSTHPHPESRIEELERIIQERYPGYDDPSKYRFNFDEFRVNVLAPLSRLPAPRHTGQSSP